VSGLQSLEHGAAGVGVMTAGPRIIVAFDVATEREALELAAQLDPGLCRAKVGLELFSAAGPRVVTALRERGFDVFLDLKFHDIPTTVARACAAAAELGVWMLNVHALGGAKMLQAARDTIDRSRHKPLLIAVTLLTSHDDAALAEIGFPGDIAAEVTRLAGLARTCGLDGVVCSPREATALRRRFGDAFKLVTPGVRPAGGGTQDQARTLTPSEALAQGADYLVIGRPITRAADPGAALVAIAASVEAVASGRQHPVGPG
jgi:orotidine-5'-phosphate decarboxylase